MLQCLTDFLEKHMDDIEAEEGRQIIQNWIEKNVKSKRVKAKLQKMLL